MNREEAQFILQAYRPSSEDAHDPQFAEALALARQDPVLARWFVEEQAMDADFAAKLRARSIPSDLKSQLLLARATIARRSWWRQPVWLAAAASVTLLLVLGSWRFRSGRGEAQLGEFRDAMAKAALDMNGHVAAFGMDAPRLKQWLTAHRGHPDFVLPPKLAEQGVMGCKIVEWQGHRVTLLCLKFDGGHADIFVANAADLPGAVLDDAPRFAAAGPLTTATWQRDGKIYHLAGNFSTERLKQLL
ncbi:MAG: hypothetical protein ABIZ49_02140 [Opitutaceae bacterium]